MVLWLFLIRQKCKISSISAAVCILNLINSTYSLFKKNCFKTSTDDRPFFRKSLDVRRRMSCKCLLRTLCRICPLVKNVWRMFKSEPPECPPLLLSRRLTPSTGRCVLHTPKTDSGKRSGPKSSGHFPSSVSEKRLLCSFFAAKGIERYTAPALQRSVQMTFTVTFLMLQSQDFWPSDLFDPLSVQEFHETLHSLLLWLAHAESRRYAVDIGRRDTPVRALQQHRNTLAVRKIASWE